MRLLDRIVGRPSARVAWPSQAQSWLWGSFFGASSDAGPVVTVERSLHLDAVIASIRVLSESVGTLPLKTYQRTRGSAGRGRMEVFMEPVYRLLHDEPNREMSAMDCWSLVVTHLNTWGNAYLGKNFEDAPGGRRVAELWPIKPELVTVYRQGGRKLFDVRDPTTGEISTFTSDEVVHIQGFSLDGLMGLSPISLARNSIGRGLAEDEFAASFFRNWAMPRGVLQLDGELSDDRMEALRKRWQSLYGGGNSNGVAILEGGMTFQAITMPLEDAQFVEQAKLSVQRIARLFRVPASMIGGESNDSLTYKTVEGDAIHFERYSIRPWVVRIEQALARDRDLFPGAGRSMYPEFVTDAILRADTKTRYESYALALSPDTGWMNREEVRALENLPPEPSAPASLTQLDQQAARLIADPERARARSHTNGGGRRAVHV
jgi:HK97 family phage portal protein